MIIILFLLICVLFLFCICLARRLPDKAIDLVDESCAHVRVHLDSQPEEIDYLERKAMQLKIEIHALEKEKDDKASEARLVEVYYFQNMFFIYKFA